MTEFIQNKVAAGESPRLDTLAKLANNMPYIFLSVIDFHDNGGLDLKFDVGGGLQDLNSIWHFLERAKKAIEIQMLEEGTVPTTTDADDDAAS